MYGNKMSAKQLSHLGIMAPYGDIDLAQHGLRQWLAAWRHQAITWTNVDLSSEKPSVIHLVAISQQELQAPITEFGFKITYLKLLLNLSGANELMAARLTRPIMMGWAADLCQVSRARCQPSASAGQSHVRAGNVDDFLTARVVPFNWDLRRPG